MSFIRNKIRFSKVGVALGLAAIKSRRCAGRTEARQCENVALGFRSGQENLRFLASFWCCTNATVKVQSNGDLASIPTSCLGTTSVLSGMGTNKQHYEHRSSSSLLQRRTPNISGLCS